LLKLASCEFRQKRETSLFRATACGLARVDTTPIGDIDPPWGTGQTLHAIKLLNKRQWANPCLDIFSNNFGRITSANGQRTFTPNLQGVF